MDGAKRRVNELVRSIKRAVPKGNGILIPISGGTDSALAFWLCSQALPSRTIGVYVGKDLREKKWFESVGVVHYLKAIKAGKNPEVGRWSQFLELSIAERRILVGTRNKTEQLLGTYSLASRIAWFFPVVGLWKTEIMELCSFVGVPQVIIDSSSKADPACGRPEELAQIPLELIDIFIQFKTGLVSKRVLSKFSKGQLQYLEGIYKQNSFKNSLPITLGE